MQKFCPDGETGRRNRLKICCPKGRAGSTPAPGTIFLYAGRSRFAGARLAVVAARVEYASTLPLRTPRQNPPGCARSLLIPGGGNYWLQARVGGWHVAVRRGTDKYGGVRIGWMVCQAHSAGKRAESG